METPKLKLLKYSSLVAASWRSRYIHPYPPMHKTLNDKAHSQGQLLVEVQELVKQHRYGEAKQVIGELSLDPPRD
jgi:hypothetical protein